MKKFSHFACLLFRFVGASFLLFPLKPLQTWTCYIFPHSFYFSSLFSAQQKIQVRLRRLCHVPAGGLPAALTVPYQCISRPGQPLAGGLIFQGSDPDGVRAELGAAAVELPRARVQGEEMMINSCHEYY